MHTAAHVYVDDKKKRWLECSVTLMDRSEPIRHK